MPDHVDSLTGHEASTYPEANKEANVTEEQSETNSEKPAKDLPPEKDSKGSVEFSRDDDVDYVKGHPVIRNGNCLMRPRFFFATANPPQKVSTYRGLLYPCGMTVTRL